MYCNRKVRKPVVICDVVHDQITNEAFLSVTDLTEAYRVYIPILKDSVYRLVVIDINYLLISTAWCNALVFVNYKSYFIDTTIVIVIVLAI